MDAPATTRECRDALAAARNADGGWGYGPGRGSRLEPTALALLALRAVGDAPATSVLGTWPRAHGLLKDPQSGEVNLTQNGQAALAAQALGMGELASWLHAGLIRVKGQSLPQNDNSPQDNSLQGWPWVADTFSWVEPTAWCLLAVKRWAITHPTLDAASRIDEAERLLRDRACEGGGWNYGNAIMLGQKLAAYVPTTAVSLLALGSAARDAAVESGVKFLEAHRLEEPSGLALSLARVALARHGASTAGIDEALGAAWQRDRFLGNLMTTALALYALAAADRYDALAV